MGLVQLGLDTDIPLRHCNTKVSSRLDSDFLNEFIPGRVADIDFVTLHFPLILKIPSRHPVDGFLYESLREKQILHNY